MSKLTDILKLIMAWVARTIAKVGQMPDFGYFFAHAGAAQYYASRFPRGPVRIGAAVVGAAVTFYKEIFFDPKHEVNPPQKIWPDGCKDLFGYWTGLLIGQFDK